MRTQQASLSKDIISASEIGQYHYCSVAWYLQKCGYKPDSKLLDIGTKKHIQYGDIIDETELDIKRSKLFTTAGYLLLTISILILLFEVVL